MTAPTSVCFLCGKASANTREHYVPKVLYPKGKPSAGLTAPAHVACNKSTEKDDQAMFVTWSTARASRVQGSERFARASRALVRPEARGMALRFLASMTRLPGPGARLEIDERQQAYVLAKMVKGFVYRECRELILKNLWLVQRSTMANMVSGDACNTVEVPDVLTAKWQHEPSLRETYFAWLGIYGNHFYFVLSAPGDVMGQLPQGDEAETRPWPRIR